MSIDIEAVFYTQLGSIFAFIVSLFVLYRLVVSSKDATIEMLKQQVGFQEARVKAYAETAPDILLQRIEKRAATLEKELETAEGEKEPLIKEIEELQKKIAAPESQAQLQALVKKLVAASLHVALLDAEREQLASRFREAEDHYRQFLSYGNGELSPGRREIVGKIVSHFGLDYVISSSFEDLINRFTELVVQTHAFGMHPEIPTINGGAFTGLRSAGLIGGRDVLTLLGVSVFKAIATELKSNPPLKPASAP